MAKNVKKVNADNGKHVYEVTFYWHTNNTVTIASDEELTDEEVIELARNEECDTNQIMCGLQEDSSPDVVECDSEEYAFDRNGKIIRVDDHVMWTDTEWNENYVGKVYKVDPEMVRVKCSWGSECELFPNECVVVSV